MDTVFVQKLGLNSLLKIEGDFVIGRSGPGLERMFTSDTAVINYRLDALTDLLENNVLFEGVSGLLPEISVLREARSLNSGRMPTDETEGLYAVRDLNIYVNVVSELYDVLKDCEVHSELFVTLKNEVNRINADSSFDGLKRSIPENAEIISELQSVTVGVNLDKALRPVEAGVVSLNKEKFKSGNIVDRILRLDLGDDFQCVSSLAPLSGSAWSEEERELVSKGINSAIYKVVRSSLKQWKPAIKAYISQKTDFLINCCADLRFLVSAGKLCRALREAGYPICRPEVCGMPEKKFTVRGAYNPEMALGGVKMIGNDVSFGETEKDDGMLYIFTGANGGGKTVFMRTVGYCQALFQMGVYVPAEQAEISPVSELLIHSASTHGTFSQSRFTDECAKLSEIMKIADDNTMILCDEALSGTSAFEAAAIAEEVLRAMSAKGCRGIFITHIHELALLPEKLNGLPECVSKIGNLAVETDEDSGARTYKTVRGKAPGKSYASDIANKYGLSFEQLMKKES